MRHSLVVAHIKRNRENVHRNWPFDNGAESFELMQQNVHSNFTVENKKSIAKQDLPKLKICDTLE